MGDMDFSELGRELEEKIKKFANSKEMKDLQENIHMAVDNTMKEVRRSAKDAADYINENVDVRREGTNKENKCERQIKTENTQSSKSAVSYKKRRLPVIKKPTGGGLGVLLSLIGTCGAITTWTVVLTGLGLTFLGSDILGILLQVFWGEAFAGSLSSGMTSLGVISFGMVAIIAVAFTLTSVVGGIMRRRAKRFKNYMNTIGVKEYYAIEELAQGIGKNPKYVIKDLKKMMLRRWFREGHFDDQETCFMLTDETYQIYLNTQAELKQRKEEEEQQKKEQEQQKKEQELLEQDPVRKQLRITIAEGKEYIRRIRDINDEMPEEDISGKLYRLERICTRIFEYIKEKPDQLDDIRKFMNYYLPTTLKLVETYYEFSVQPVRGENITTAQKEIEAMLDHINQAFEKMFDKLFEDSAMDISTDISVLSTILAQEGLLDNEFK